MPQPPSVLNGWQMAKQSATKQAPRYKFAVYIASPRDSSVTDATVSLIFSTRTLLPQEVRKHQGEGAK